MVYFLHRYKYQHTTASLFGTRMRKHNLIVNTNLEND